MEISLQMCLCLLPPQHPKAPLTNELLYVTGSHEVCTYKASQVSGQSPCKIDFLELLHTLSVTRLLWKCWLWYRVLDHSKTKPTQENLTETLQYVHTKPQLSNATPLSISEVIELPIIISTLSMP